MKLYLVQHGLSQSKEVDPERPLSPEGEVESRLTADFLKEKNIRISRIWHSPKKRAVQTARIMAERLSSPEIQERNDLNPLDPVGSYVEEIALSDRDLMIVGHLPFLQKLTSLLLNGTEDDELVSVRNSGIICLEYTDSWRVLWAVFPELLAGQGRHVGFDSSKFGC